MRPFAADNVPGSVQTQATGINHDGEIVRFYTDGAGNVHGMPATGSAVRTSHRG